MKSETLREDMSFTSFAIIVKTYGAVARPKGRELNWNTSDLWQNLGISLSWGGWGCGGKRPTGVSAIPTALEPGLS